LSQLEDVSAIRSKSNYRQDLGPSRILGTDLDSVALLQFRVGKGDTKDGRLGSLISAKMGGINVNIVDTGKVGCQSDDHPERFSVVMRIDQVTTYQSKAGLCLLDSQASYSAPVGPNWPFIEILGFLVSIRCKSTE
jgi:hypothetical protein